MEADDEILQAKEEFKKAQQKLLQVYLTQISEKYKAVISAQFERP